MSISVLFFLYYYLTHSRHLISISIVSYFKLEKLIFIILLASAREKKCTNCFSPMLTVCPVIVCLHTERLKFLNLKIYSSSVKWWLLESRDEFKEPSTWPRDRTLGSGLRSKKGEEMRYSSLPWYLSGLKNAELWKEILESGEAFCGV